MCARGIYWVSLIDHLFICTNISNPHFGLIRICNACQSRGPEMEMDYRLYSVLFVFVFCWPICLVNKTLVCHLLCFIIICPLPAVYVPDWLIESKCKIHAPGWIRNDFHLTHIITIGLSLRFLLFNLGLGVLLLLLFFCIFPLSWFGFMFSWKWPFNLLAVSFETLG